jgi:NADPH:quinone reductase-like Zn-dependent oxidoreductase
LALDGHSALVHRAAASNLSQMLVKVCAEDGISLENIVRTQLQAEMLKHPGAQHICDSSHSSFRNDVVRAVQDTGATIAFDAVGRGTLASELIYAPHHG